MHLALALAVLEFWGGAATPRSMKAAEEIAQAIEDEAQGLDPFIVLAVVLAESEGNQNARGTHGEVGLMQVHPKAGHCPTKQLYTVRGNIACGVSVMRKARVRCGGQPERWLVAYNNPHRCGAAPYTKRVMRVFRRL